MAFLYLIAIGALVYLVNLVFKMGLQQGMKAGFKESEKRDRIKKDLCRLEGFRQANNVFNAAYAKFKKDLIETKNWGEFKEREDEELQRKAKIAALIQQAMNERNSQMQGMFGNMGSGLGRAHGDLYGTMMDRAGLGGSGFDSMTMDALLANLRAQQERDKHE